MARLGSIAPPTEKIYIVAISHAGIVSCSIRLGIGTKYHAGKWHVFRFPCTGHNRVEYNECQLYECNDGTR